MLPAELQSFAVGLADAARRVIPPFTNQAITVSNKGEGGGLFDPVTQSDRAAEQAMRTAIEDSYPGHGIAGEEFGEKPGDSRYSWSLDPIDGTRSYTCGLPSWTILIALLEDGRPVFGVIDAPRLDERYTGDGSRAWVDNGDGLPDLRCSACTDLAQARLSTTDPFLFRGPDLVAFERLQALAQTTRYGLDAYAYARLAAGTLDLVVECGLKPHDYHALIPVVRGAGGVFGDWNGGDDLAAGNVIAAATPQLYDAAVRIMNGQRDVAEARR